MNVWVLIVIAWMANGEVRTDSISAPNQHDCVANQPLIERDMRARDKKIKAIRSVCVEFVHP